MSDLVHSEQLASLTFIDQTTIGIAARKLIEKTMITRARNPADRRWFASEATAPGAQQVWPMLSKAEQDHRPIIKRFASAEPKALLDLLQKVRDG